MDLENDPLPPSKRLKLCLEPIIEPAVFDVDENGVEILEKEPTPAETLSKNISKLNFQKLLKKDLLATENNENEEATSENGDRAHSIAPTSKALVFEPRIAPVEMMKQKIFFAKSEIELMIDVVNRLIYSSKQPPQPLPNATSSLIRIHQANRGKTLPLHLQLKHNQIMLASARESLRTASTQLSSYAQQLLTILEEEHEFYGTAALELRKRLWILQTRPTAPNPLFRIVVGRGLYIDYGYRNVGSLFDETAEADLVRDIAPSPDLDDQHSEDGIYVSKGMRVQVPHIIPKRVVVKIIKSSENIDDVQFSLRSDFLQQQQMNETDAETDTLLSHQTLLSARETAFASELFSEIMRELSSAATTDKYFTTSEYDSMSRKLAQFAKISSKGVVVPLGDDLKLVVKLLKGKSQVDEATSTTNADKKNKDESRKSRMDKMIDILANQRLRQIQKSRKKGHRFKISQPTNLMTPVTIQKGQETAALRSVGILPHIVSVMNGYTSWIAVRKCVEEMVSLIRKGNTPSGTRIGCLMEEENTTSTEKRLLCRFFVNGIAPKADSHWISISFSHKSLSVEFASIRAGKGYLKVPISDLNQLCKLWLNEVMVFGMQCIGKEICHAGFGVGANWKWDGGDVWGRGSVGEKTVYVHPTCYVAGSGEEKDLSGLRLGLRYQFWIETGAEESAPQQSGGETKSLVVGSVPGEDGAITGEREFGDAVRSLLRKMIA